MALRPAAQALLLDRLQIIDDRRDVVRVEHKDRHVGMAQDDDALSQRFGQILDRVFVGRRAEGRRLRMRDYAFPTDGVAARAVPADQRLALDGQVCLSGLPKRPGLPRGTGRGR